MKGWKNYLLWEGLPFWMLFVLFGGIAAINWDYECKLLTSNTGASDWVGSYQGPVLLVVALGLATVASTILFIVRLTRPESNSTWYMLISLTLVTIFLIFPSLGIIILGPAGISIMEATRPTPTGPIQIIPHT